MLFVPFGTIFYAATASITLNGDFRISPFEQLVSWAQLRLLVNRKREKKEVN